MAARDGQEALAITDTNALYGFLPFFGAAEAAGVRPIVGACVREEGGTEAVLLVTDRTGYGSLCRIISKRHLMPDEFSLEGALLEWPAGLIVLSEDEGLLRALAEELPPGDLFVELRYYPTVAKLKLAIELSLPPVATGGVYFPRERDRNLMRVLVAIRQNLLAKEVSDDDLAPPAAAFATREEMAARFRMCPEAIAATVRIADRCRFPAPRSKAIFPKFPVPRGETAWSLLMKRSFAGAAERYHPLRPVVVQRLQEELSVIQDLGFAEYFLIVDDITRHARSLGIPMVGRGSAADSLVAYCLGLTIVDPIEFDLYFERFLNRSRTDPPDIDMDIGWRGRDEVLDYVYETYGRDRVAMISTINTFQGRSSFREAAKVLGLSPSEISRHSKRLPSHYPGPLAEAVKSLPECRGLDVSREPFRTILTIADRIEGYPRHLSVHPGGIVIAPTEITDYVPVQRSAKGLVITQFDKDPIEETGLVKIDLLGQRSLSAIADTVATVERNHGERIEIATIPSEDERTAGMLSSARTMGCFQVESPGTRNLLSMLKAQNQRDAMVALSLIRPGPAAGGMKEHFVLRKAGEEPLHFLHESLQRVLEDTYGVMLYQEDILKVANAVAGFTLEEADQLRRAITKERSTGRIRELKETFLSHAEDLGTRREEAEPVWLAVENFVGYSFSKAHAATYGRTAWQAVWLKCRYPAEFMAAVLANGGGFYESRAYLEEARRLGVRIHLPDVNRSEREFAAMDGGIRIGLSRVRDLKEKTLERILDERERCPFLSLRDFVTRVATEEREVTNLVLAGAFDAFDQPRPALLWRVRVLFGRDGSPARQTGQTLFGAEAEIAADLDGIVFPDLGDYAKEQRVETEFEVLGLSATAHPLEFFEQWLAEKGAIPTSDIRERRGGYATVGGWLTTTRRVRTSRGEFMRFLTIEDRTGTVEAILFPKVYQRYGHLLRGQGPYLLKGKVEDAHGATTLTVGHVALAPTDRPSEGW
jgi:DNA-directed DNA polymerase III PolC